MKPPYQIVKDGTKHYYCSMCQKYQIEQKFYPSSIEKGIRRCKKCTSEANNKRQKTNNNQFQKILRYVKRIGRGHHCKVFLDEKDIKELIETIWKGKSCISKQKGDDLVLVPWTLQPSRGIYPWHCVLVTKKEAKRHNVLVLQHENHQGAISCLYQPNVVIKIQKRLDQIHKKMKIV